jgi:hypothetical protein
MRQKQTNKVTMFKTVADHLESHRPIWNSMAPLATAVQTFTNKIAAIDAAVQQQEAPSAAADAKGAARDDLEEILFMASEALGVLAHASNDHELSALTDLTPAMLEKLPGDELINRAALVLERANARKTELATLMVTQANLDELTAALEKFSGLRNQPRTSVVERTTQTEAIERLIREANEILVNELDRMVNLFARTNPEFVAGYEAARRIVDRAATHKTKTAGGTPPAAQG